MLKFHWRNSARLRKGVKWFFIVLVLIAIAGGGGVGGYFVGYDRAIDAGEKKCDIAVQNIIKDYQRIMQNNCEPLLIRQQMMFARQFESWIAPYNVWVAHLQEQLKACKESQL